MKMIAEEGMGAIFKGVGPRVMWIFIRRCRVLRRTGEGNDDAAKVGTRRLQPVLKKEKETLQEAMESNRHLQLHIK